MLIHKDEINSYIEIANALDKPSCPKVGQDFEFLYNLLIWLKSLSLVLEKDGWHVFNIIPLLRELFVQLALLYESTDNKEDQGIIDSLDSIMRVRLLKNAYSETMTMDILSGNGRDEIRKQYKAIRVVNPQVILSTPILDTPLDKRSKFEHKLMKKRHPMPPQTNILHSPGSCRFRGRGNI